MTFKTDEPVGREVMRIAPDGKSYSLADDLTLDEAKKVIASLVEMRCTKTAQIGIGDPVVLPAALEVVGVVCVEETALYDYADIRDDNYNSMLAVPLLKFVGKRVRVRVEVLED